MYTENEEKQGTLDQLTLVTASMFMAYGIVGMVVLAISQNAAEYWFLSGLFILLGLAFLVNPTDTSKTVLGIIGLIGSFYAASIWLGFVESILSDFMILFSITLLALCLGMICHLTCTWPNLDYD